MIIKIKEQTLSEQPKLLKALIESRIPFKIVSTLQLYQNFDNSLSFDEQVKQISQTTNESEVEVSMSIDGNFSGHYENHSVQKMSMVEFLNYKGNIKMYLAQHPIYMKKKIFTQLQDEFLQHSLNYPSYLKSSHDQLELANVWASKIKTTSQWHYDAYHNFNYMLKGKKQFLLAPPTSSKVIPQPIISWSSNHAIKTSFNKNKSFQSKKIKKLKYLSSYFKIKKLKTLKKKLLFIRKNMFKYKQFQRINIKENEAIYIPEGYWHKVKSFSDLNLSVNFWFKGVHELVKGQEKYVIRMAFKNLLDESIKLYISNNIKKYLHQFKDQRLEDIAKEDILSLSQIFICIHKLDPEELLLELIDIGQQDTNLLQRLLASLDLKNIELLTIKFEQLPPKDAYLFEELWQTIKDDHIQKLITLHFEKSKEKLRKKLLNKLMKQIK